MLLSAGNPATTQHRDPVRFAIISGGVFEKQSKVCINHDLSSAFSVTTRKEIYVPKVIAHLRRTVSTIPCGLPGRGLVYARPRSFTARGTD